MTFGEAIDAAKNGHKIKRTGWNGKGQYVELGKDFRFTTASGENVISHHDAIGSLGFVFFGTSGSQVGWLASQADMLAEDWVFAD